MSPWRRFPKDLNTLTNLDHRTGTSLWVYAIIGSIMFGLVLLAFSVLVFYLRERRYEDRKLKHEKGHSAMIVDQRYTDLPKMFVST